MPVIPSDYSVLRRKIIDCEREIGEASVTLYRLRLVSILLNQVDPPFGRFTVIPFKCLCYRNSIFNVIVKDEGPLPVSCFLCQGSFASCDPDKF